MIPPEDAETVTERQDRLLAAEDGRHFAVGKHGTGLAHVAATEKIGPMIASFSLPSAPALFLSLAHRAFATYRDVDVSAYFNSDPEGIWPDDHTPLFDFCEQYAAHVVFAFTALESFANEAIPQDYSYTSTWGTKKGKPGHKVVYSGDEIARNVSLGEKLARVLPDALKVPTPKGLHIWRNYKSLKGWRDRIIHLKMADRQSSGPEVKTIWGDMLRHPKEPFCDHVHELMGYFKPAVIERRWYGKYPY
jgi:hypothetical protein